LLRQVEDAQYLAGAQCSTRNELSAAAEEWQARESDMALSASVDAGLGREEILGSVDRLPVRFIGE
jgi:hypothetical protein